MPREFRKRPRHRNPLGDPAYPSTELALAPYAPAPNLTPWPPPAIPVVQSSTAQPIVATVTSTVAKINDSITAALPPNIPWQWILGAFIVGRWSKR